MKSNSTSNHILSDKQNWTAVQGESHLFSHKYDYRRRVGRHEVLQLIITLTKFEEKSQQFTF